MLQWLSVSRLAKSNNNSNNNKNNGGGSSSSSGSKSSKSRLIIDNSIDVDFTISFVSENEVGEKIQHIRDVLKQEFNADSIHIHLSEEIDGEDEDGYISKNNNNNHTNSGGEGEGGEEEYYDEEYDEDDGDILTK